MALGTSDLGKIVALGAPVLLLDTCVILDVIRDITRKEVQAHNVKAAADILRASETGTSLVMLMADQVSTELSANLSVVENEAESALEKFLDQAERIDEIALEFGAPGKITTSHLDDHVTRARAVMDRWVRVAMSVAQGPDVASKAMLRVVNAIAPSRRGKESAKDCLIVETYLEAAEQLRAAQFNGKIVFGSSNTEDYLDQNTKRLHSALEKDFARHGIEYGRNYGAMRHLLGV